MATEREYDPGVMTDEERLERKRVDSGIAFELGHAPVSRSTIRGYTRHDHFVAGATDHLPEEAT